MNSVYITRLAAFLPNDPVGNDDMEAALGMVNGKPSRARSIVLRNNGIQKRYYALKDGVRTHTNVEIAAESIRKLFEDGSKKLEDVALLACGTTSPEQMLPSHGVMVHGALHTHPMEVVSCSGACCASMQAMKFAYSAVAAGWVQSAIASGSERMSANLLGKRFQPEADTWKDIEKNPFLAFEKDFLRWMLSDGSGAALLEARPNPAGISFKIEWLEMISYANELETCMYAGGIKNEDGTLESYHDLEHQDWAAASVFAYKQDTRLLGENIIKKGGAYLKELVAKHKLRPGDVNWFLPHMSSNFFKKEIMEHLERIDFVIPEERWFYNLTEVGNVGSASPYLMLEELMHSGKAQKGDHILMMVPESARFTYAYMYLTVV